jgi:hypothetical protein
MSASLTESDSDEESPVFRLFGVVDLVTVFFGLRSFDPFTGTAFIRNQRSKVVRERVQHNQHQHLNIKCKIDIHVDSL